MSSTSVVALIPARGGSKSIPYKNIKPINGRPLICYTIDAALECFSVDKVFVSTEDEKIKEIVRRFYDQDEVAIHHRTQEAATDLASTESVMLEFAAGIRFDHIILIQPTSPLLTAEDLNGGMEKYRSNSYQGLVSVVRQKRFIWEQGDASAKPTNYDYLARPRRQDFDGVLVENGAFYITSRTALIESGCRISEPIALYEMDEASYFEVDVPSDWSIVEALLKSRASSKKQDRLNNVQLFITDVDGVLTDSGMYYSEFGDELKKFNTRDGKGLELLRNLGVKTAIITSESTALVKRRGEKLKVDFVYQGIKNKGQKLAELLEKVNDIRVDQIAYIGDDLNDLSIIEQVGVTACPANAVPEVKQQVDYVLSAKGGEGCVREFADIIRAAKVAK